MLIRPRHAKTLAVVAAAFLAAGLGAAGKVA